MPDIPQVTLPHPYDTLSTERIIELAHQCLDEAVGKLTNARQPGK